MSSTPHLDRRSRDTSQSTVSITGVSAGPRSTEPSHGAGHRPGFWAQNAPTELRPCPPWAHRQRPFQATLALLGKSPDSIGERVVRGCDVRGVSRVGEGRTRVTARGSCTGEGLKPPARGGVCLKQRTGEGEASGEKWGAGTSSGPAA